MIEVLHGDSVLELSMMPDNSVDSIVTDPPYGINFMGKHWDYDLPNVDIWKECLRVLKPGGHMLVACGTRTQHRMAVNVEDAGFEIRDVITWHYGSGFPKSLDVSKAIDKAAKVERKVIGKKERGSVEEAKKKGVGYLADPANRNNVKAFGYGVELITEPATDEAKQWDGWGTALKPATEFWTLARKPLSEKTIAENVIKWGTGAINIDATRIATDEKLSIGSNNRKNGTVNFGMKDDKEAQAQNELGRFPANLIHDGSVEVLEHFPDSEGQLAATKADGSDMGNKIFGKRNHPIEQKQPRRENNKSAARFFYCAKASKSERNKGLEDLPLKLKVTQMRSANGTGEKNFDGGFQDSHQQNTHPTVKPVALMQYLCRLITPPGGIVLDPFAGSGTTGVAAKLENFSAILIEREAEYIEIINKRTA